ncbi:putative leader peptide [Planobispora rosea]
MTNAVMLTTRGHVDLCRVASALCRPFQSQIPAPTPEGPHQP